MSVPAHSFSSIETTVQQALLAAKHQLAVIADNPLFEAEILLAHVLQKPRSYLHAFAESRMSSEEVCIFADFLQRRRGKEPIAYITDHREFWSLDLMVSKDTLIPRPETELLVETILKKVDEPNASIKVADLGTGSGAIGLALAHERPAWQIYATDASESALHIARKNAHQLGLQNVYFYLGNWCTALPCKDFDVIVSNPPYIGEAEWEAYAEGLEFEPRSALVASGDGLDAIRAICHMASLYLKPAGYVLVEHGFLQGAAVRKIFAASGYSQIQSVRDLSGHERVSMATYHP